MVYSETTSTFPLLQPLLIERRPLLEKLNHALHHRLTLLIAPPGYGKTTLMTQFAAQASVPIAWHSVENRERDVPTLFEHSLAALSTIVPGIIDLKPPQDVTASERALLVTDYLRATCTSDFIYILDDIHHFMGSPAAEHWLRTFIAAMPTTCHLMLIGRALPPIATITEMITRREVLAVGQEQFKFSFQEVGALADRAGVTLDAAQTQKILARFDGWPAGVFLALQPLPADLETLIFSGSAGPEALFFSLAAFTLQAQPPLLRDFLLRSSTLTKMTPTLCQSILQLPNSLEYLTEALNRNLFITQVPGGLVYHTLFRAFLQQQMESENPAQFAQLHNAAGHWFETHNRLDEAFDHYVAAQLWDHAVEIADSAVQLYAAQGKTETVLGWRAQLDSLSVQAPRLLYACAMIQRDRYQYDLASADLAQAAAGFRQREDGLGLLQVALLEATIDNQQGQYQRALDSVEPLLQHTALPAHLQGYALAIRGTAHLYLGQVDTALDDLETALPLWRATGDAFALAQLLMTVEVAYLRQGRFQDAAACLQEVAAIRRALGSTAGIVMALNNLGYHAHLLGDYQQALLTFQEGMAVASRVQEHRAESYLLWSLGDLQRDRGAFGEAESLYHRALQLSGTGEPFLRISVLVSLATLKRWQQQLAEAAASAAEAMALAEKHHLLQEHLKGAVALWAVRMEQGEAAAAREPLFALAGAWRQHGSSTRLGQTLGLCAQAALLLVDGAEAHQHLTAALQGVNHPANLQPLIAEIHHTPLLRHHVLHHSGRYAVLVEGMARLAAAQAAPTPVPTPPKKADTVPTYSLRVLALGQEMVERDGSRVPLAVWQAAAARELFFYFLFRGAAPREQIGLLFWADDSPQQIRQKFHTTLHRVRDAVGTNAVIFEDELYSINPDIDLWCDVIEFEALIQQAQLTAPRLAHTETLWRRAAALYRGEFLADFDSAWIIGYREALSQKYVDVLLALGQCIRLRGDIAAAIATFKQALTHDPYREDLHRALLACYAAAGQRTLILRQLEDLKQLLDEELGITPSLETVTLAHSFLT